ncbi:GNAT family N-acetyltransferase [Naasia lichenicola]|nr:GNAT family N-acetyltransferase [Naasia lichenicola]
MVVTLSPMPDERFAAWILAKTLQYAESREAAGETPAQARATARESEAVNFPDGRPLELHRVFEIIADGDPVGSLWIGPHPQHPDGVDWWVYQIEVDEESRGNGYGRQAMLLAEREVAALGGVTLGLNVFGFNTVARELYASLGYEVTSLQLRKPVAPADDEKPE